MDASLLLMAMVVVAVSLTVLAKVVKAHEVHIRADIFGLKFWIDIR